MQKSLQLVLRRSSLADLGIKELDETSLRPLSVKVDNGVVPGLDQLDGGEALHLDLLKLIGSAEMETMSYFIRIQLGHKQIIPVHLGNDNVGVVGILLPQLVPDRSELLAMSAPRGIKLNHDQIQRLNIMGKSVSIENRDTIVIYDAVISFGSR